MLYIKTNIKAIKNILVSFCCQCHVFFTPWPIRPKGIAIISVRPAGRPHMSNLNIMKHASHRATRHILKGWTYRGIIDPEGIFQIGSFWGKKSFFEKKFVVGDFVEGIGLEPWNLVGWSHILGALDYWKEFMVEWFLRKLWLFFENWT